MRPSLRAALLAAVAAGTLATTNPTWAAPSPADCTRRETVRERGASDIDEASVGYTVDLTAIQADVFLGRPDENGLYAEASCASISYGLTVTRANPNPDGSVTLFGDPSTAAVPGDGSNPIRIVVAAPSPLDGWGGHCVLAQLSTTSGTRTLDLAPDVGGYVVCDDGPGPGLSWK